MAGTGGARDRHNGRRQGILVRSLDEVRSKHREVKMTGGAHAHCGIMCWFWQVDVPDPQRGEKWWHGDVAGDAHARGAQRSSWSGEKAAVTASYGSGGYSDRSS